MTWQPTNELRWFAKPSGLYQIDHKGNKFPYCSVPVLQQKWEKTDAKMAGYLPKYYEEWRDVPTAKEDENE